MPKELVISAPPHETRVAILEEGQLCEIYIEREKEFALVGSIYKGRVTRVLPGMQSAFVEIGLDSDAFLYVSDFLENLEEYDQIVTTVEGKVQKMEQQGGQVFAAPAAATAPTPSPTAGAASEPAAFPGAESVEPHAPEAASGAAATDVAARPAPPPVQTPPPYQRRDRGPGGFDRDRGRRGGRGRPGGGRDRGSRHGRDLPPSKYASHRPYDPPPSGPSAPVEEPILLPGESLAKYKDKDRMQAGATAALGAGTPASAEGFVAPVAPSAPHAEQAPAQPHQEAAPWLPESRYHRHQTPSADQREPAVVPPPTEKTFPTPAAPWSSSHETGAPLEAPEPHQAAAPAPAFGEEHPVQAHFEPDLSDDEVTALAEQLAEAKHEEAQAEAEEVRLGEGEDAAADVLAEPYELQGAAEELEGAEGPSAEAVVEAAGAEPGGEPQGMEPREAPGEAEPRQYAARVDDRSRARFQRPMRRGGHHRGGRHPAHHARHTPPRRPQLISEMLKTGQEIIVQIAKEPLGKKGARITSHVALPGRFLVYMPTVDHIGVSRKIASAEERARLRRIVSEAKVAFPGGFIVRTAAEGASEEEVRSDVEFLGRTWAEIRSRSDQRKAPALLHRDLNLVERILRDYVNSDYTAIWIDNEEEFGKVVEFVGRFQPKLVGRVKLYTKEAPIFEEFGIQQELDKALRPKVWLKSGGYIVINHTEALVAIDVNTGKYVGKGSTRLEDTIVKTNLEAVKEIVRQIRLRDLGGIIVVDFIDMEERRNREKVMAALEQALQSDRAPSKVLSFNEFGLVAITRKRTKQALERVLCQPCPYCTGSGMVKSVPTICYEIQGEARKMSSELDSPSLTLRVHPEIAKALKTRESSLVEELEQVTRKSIIIQSDPTLHWEQYDIY